MRIAPNYKEKFIQQSYYDYSPIDFTISNKLIVSHNWNP